MSKEFESEDYLHLYLDEVEHQLDNLERDSLLLERHFSPKTLEQVFRAVHTLKGSSRAMGFANMADLSHWMENLLEELRSREVEPTHAFFDVFSKSQEKLRELKLQVEAVGSDDCDCSELISAMSVLQGPREDARQTCRLPEFSEELASEHLSLLGKAAETAPVIQARFTLAADCEMRFARVFMILNLIYECGELLHSNPDLESLSAEHFGHRFDFYFHSSESLDRLKTKLLSVSEVAACEMNIWKPPAASPQPLASAGHDQRRFLRVQTDAIEELRALAGELALAAFRLNGLEDRLPRPSETVELQEASHQIGSIAGRFLRQLDLVEQIPLETTFKRVAQSAKEIAERLGKNIRLELHGGGIQVPRGTADLVFEVLLHLSTNSIDHGIEPSATRSQCGKAEQGSIVIAAKKEGSFLSIAVSDDGNGIDTDRLRNRAIQSGRITEAEAAELYESEALMLIFESGLSTAETVTEFSGRGVGMDAVMVAIRAAGGDINVESTPEQGCKVAVRLPLSQGNLRGLLVRAGGFPLIIPSMQVIGTIPANRQVSEQKTTDSTVTFEGNEIPALSLCDLFAKRDSGKQGEVTENYFVVVELGQGRAAFLVDRILGERQMTIDHPGKCRLAGRGISGVTILEDGGLALVADLSEIINSHGEGRNIGQ